MRTERGEEMVAHRPQLCPGALPGVAGSTTLLPRAVHGLFRVASRHREESENHG